MYRDVGRDGISVLSQPSGRCFGKVFIRNWWTCKRTMEERRIPLWGEAQLLCHVNGKSLIESSSRSLTITTTTNLSCALCCCSRCCAFNGIIFWVQHSTNDFIMTVHWSCRPNKWTGLVTQDIFILKHPFEETIVNFALGNTMKRIVIISIDTTPTQRVPLTES